MANSGIFRPRQLIKTYSAIAFDWHVCVGCDWYYRPDAGRMSFPCCTNCWEFFAAGWPTVSIAGLEVLFFLVKVSSRFFYRLPDIASVMNWCIRKWSHSYSRVQQFRLWKFVIDFLPENYAISLACSSAITDDTYIIYTLACRSVVWKLICIILNIFIIYSHQQEIAIMRTISRK